MGVLTDPCCARHKRRLEVLHGILVNFFPKEIKLMGSCIYDKVSANVMISVQKMGESGQMVF